jgi:hypothetical protein
MIRSIKGGLVVFAVAALSACGGGSGSTGSGTQVPNTGTNANTSTNTSANSSLPPFVVFTPSAKTLASQKTNSSLLFTTAGTVVTSATQGCSSILNNKTVYEQAHTVTFAADGVSEKDHQEVAEYAEEAALELRAKFPAEVPSTTGFFENKRVYLCIQRETINGPTTPAAASPILSASYAGIVLIQAPTDYFARIGARDRTMEGSQQYIQDAYRRTAAHEMTHLVQNFSTGLMDQWFTEGFARWIEFGKPATSKDLILTRIAAQNPLTIVAPASNAGAARLNEYSAPAAVIAYLLSPTGTNNSIATISAFWAKYNADIATLNAGCRTTPVSNDCATLAAYEAKRVPLFVAAFEASFKEKDGSPMKLRSGVNNLQDTLVARITAFW